MSELPTTPWLKGNDVNWESPEPEGSGSTIGVTDANGNQVAFAVGGLSLGLRNETDEIANLIAAAPYLKEACEQVTNNFTLDDGTCGLCGSDSKHNALTTEAHERWCPIRQVWAALAKARSEGE